MVLKVRDADSSAVYLETAGAGTIDDPFAPIHKSSTTGPVKEYLPHYLDTNGDGTGIKNAVGNYAGATEIFYIQPPPGTVYRLSRMLVYIEDSGTFDSGSYGNGITLTNGITVRTQNDGGTLIDLTDGIPILRNPHWKRMCYDEAPSTYGSGNEALGIRWTFTKAGTFLRLDGDNNDRFEVVLNDDFSDLVEHYFLIQGFVE